MDFNRENTHTLTTLTDMLGVTERTIFLWREKGYFPQPDYKLGRRLLWKKSSVDNWLAETAVYQ